jgi:hypothetical protein
MVLSVNFGRNGLIKLAPDRRVRNRRDDATEVASDHLEGLQPGASPTQSYQIRFSQFFTYL